jgi:2-polyprenyl-6-methoxyphenol hydroxylase-like FAD-dependent oxidoreductase
LPKGVRFVYGDTVADVEDHGDGVTATLASGLVLDSDLLVIAEGVRSATRDLLFGDRVQRRELGIAMAFGTIPRTSADDDRWRWYTTTGGPSGPSSPRPSWNDPRDTGLHQGTWCVTPMGGGGSSLALTSGYVLAAYLSTISTADTQIAAGDPIERALMRYEAWMRAMVDDVRCFPGGTADRGGPRRGGPGLGCRAMGPIASRVTADVELAAEITTTGPCT